MYIGETGETNSAICEQLSLILRFKINLFGWTIKKLFSDFESNMNMG